MDSYHIIYVQKRLNNSQGEQQYHSLDWKQAMTAFIEWKLFPEQAGVPCAEKMLFYAKNICYTADNYDLEKRDKVHLAELYWQGRGLMV